MKKNLVYVLLIILAGCAPTLRIEKSNFSPVSLSKETGLSPASTFLVFIPNNWFQTRDEKYSTDEIWVVNENYSSVITIKKINLLKPLSQKNNIETIQSLARNEVFLQKRKHDQTFKIIEPPRLFQNGELIYSAFEYSFGNNQFGRIIILEKENNYFEINAYTTNEGSSQISALELFSIQESVAQSLKVKK